MSESHRAGALGRIVCIGEGEGERRALPELVTRWLRQQHLERRFAADPAWCILAKSADRIKHPADEARRLGIEHYVRLAQVHEPAAVLVVVDADDTCRQRAALGLGPLGPELYRRAQAAVSCPVGVVVADREFESWLLADFRGLRQRGAFLPGAKLDPTTWAAPCERRDGKTALSRVLLGGYRPSVDQAQLVRQLSRGRGLRRISPSFRKLESELHRLVRAIRTAPSQ